MIGDWLKVAAQTAAGTLLVDIVGFFLQISVPEAGLKLLLLPTLLQGHTDCGHCAVWESLLQIPALQTGLKLCCSCPHCCRDTQNADIVLCGCLFAANTSAADWSRVLLLLHTLLQGHRMLTLCCVGVFLLQISALQTGLGFCYSCAHCCRDTECGHRAVWESFCCK
jgi:hypothetical protein